MRFGVAYARAHGGRRMIAHVQPANVRFFERLGWSTCCNAEDYLGLAHQPMDLALTDAWLSRAGRSGLASAGSASCSFCRR